MSLQMVVMVALERVTSLSADSLWALLRVEVFTSAIFIKLVRPDNELFVNSTYPLETWVVLLPPSVYRFSYQGRPSKSANRYIFVTSEADRRAF